MQWFWAAQQITSIVLGVALFTNRVGRGELPSMNLSVSKKIACFELPSTVLGSMTEYTQTSTPAGGVAPVSPTPLPLQILEPTRTDDQPVGDSAEIPDLHVSDQIAAQPTMTPAPAKTATPKPAPLQASLNEYRVNHGLNSLDARDDLCAVAARRLRELQANFSHEGWERAYEGISFSGIAENIWQGSVGEATDVVASWDQSSSHMQAMLGEWVYGCGAMGSGKAVFEFMR